MNIARNAVMWAVAILMVLIFIGGTALLARGDLGKVNNVVVLGDVRYVDMQELERITRNHLKFSKAAADLHALQGKLLDLPWVKQLAVAKEYPDKLVLDIQEHHVVLRQTSGELIDDQGKRFGVNLNSYKEKKPAMYKALMQLPLLDAPDYAQETAWKQFQAVQNRMAVSDFTLQALQLDERGSWQLTLQSGLVLKLGSEALLKRLQVFLAIAAPRLKTQLSKLRYVDLRYSNGFAVMRKKRS